VSEHVDPTPVTLRLSASDDDLARAAALLEQGELVAIPTETVYGLAVRADDGAAAARLFAAKGRPADNPLIVHVAGIEAIGAVAQTLTPLAARLLAAFSPGPLTVVVDARPDLPREVTGGLDTVGVRIPDHPIALALLERSGLPLAAPSANRSTRPSPTTAAHVLADLDGRIAAVVDGGPARVGLESTVVDARGELPIVLREGAVSRELLAASLGIPLAALERSGEEAIGARAPGTRYAHYAPALPVHLVDASALVSRCRELVATGLRIGVIASPAQARDLATQVGSSLEVLAAPADAAALGAELFAALRRAEQRSIDAVVLATIDETGIGRAVMDRARRAAAGSGSAR